MKFFVYTDNAKDGDCCHVCHSVEEMQRCCKMFGEDVRKVQKSENFNRETIFERCTMNAAGIACC